MKQLSILYVNFHSEEFIRASVLSYIHSTQLDLEIIIIDNSGSAEKFKPLLQEFPMIRYLDAGYNAGFARANNIGLSNAKAANILLLNPDTLLPNNILDNICHDFINSPYIAAGAQLLNEDGSPQISGNYFAKGGINHFLPLPVFGQFVKKLALFFNAKKTNLPNTDSLVEVDWINGAFILVKKEVLSKAGLLDEDFFLYAEEIEWCSRLRKQGKLAIFGQYKVIHLESASANEAFKSSGKGYYNLYDKKGLQIMVSNFLRIRKQFGTGWFLIHLAVYTLELPLLYASSFFRSLTGKSYPIGLISGYRKNLASLYKLSLKMIRNQPWFYKVL
ncbi:MAG: glycosyltransferase family 2 protein [Flavipsychrobacter sp.]|jgi:GT2 family glycosyltransferase|nr:glycosyltransferase family 2 protein [Flavipsychrobacter sp.]